MEHKTKNKKYILEKVVFNSRVSKFLKSTTQYILRYDDKVIFLGLSYNIPCAFREVLKMQYPNLSYEDMPNNFFKNYIAGEHKKITNMVKKSQESKKEYYQKLRILSRKRKIKRLKAELKQLQNNCKGVYKNGQSKNN